MPWPKHKWGWIVFDGWGNPMRDNGEGTFTQGGFGEVFLNRKAANWIAQIEKRTLARIANNQHTLDAAKPWIALMEKVKVVRIALPGTYAQVQPPSALRREKQS
jgi:hypothetical protein